MKTQFVRPTVVAVLALSTFGGAAFTTGSAHAGSDVDGRDFLIWQRGGSSWPSTNHPDFAWWPTAKPGNRLYVGNLSWNTTDTPEARGIRFEVGDIK